MVKLPVSLNDLLSVFWASLVGIPVSGLSYQLDDGGRNTSGTSFGWWPALEPV